MRKIPMVKKPCSNCPFKKDALKGWLGADRAEEIANAHSFTCHKTGETGSGPRKQCAGFMIMKEEDSAFYRLLNHEARKYLSEQNKLVFDTIYDFINHHT